MPSPTTARHRQEFPSTLKDARTATQAICGFLREQGLGDDDLFACELGITEGCNNAIHHLAAEARSPRTIVEVHCAPTHVDIYILDRTPGFDLPPTIPAPEPDIVKGRGLFLIQSMMTEMKYIRGDGQNVLHLRKTRSE